MAAAKSVPIRFASSASASDGDGTGAGTSSSPGAIESAETSSVSSSATSADVGSLLVSARDFSWSAQLDCSCRGVLSNGRKRTSALSFSACSIACFKYSSAVSRAASSMLSLWSIANTIIFFEVKRSITGPQIAMMSSVSTMPRINNDTSR